MVDGKEDVYFHGFADEKSSIMAGVFSREKDLSFSDIDCLPR